MNLVHDETYLSLYDYRGRADKDQVGKQIFNLAKQKHIKIQYRDIENKAYKGKVCLYPKWFLDEFFIK